MATAMLVTDAGASLWGGCMFGTQLMFGTNRLFFLMDRAVVPNIKYYLKIARTEVTFGAEYDVPKLDFPMLGTNFQTHIIIVLPTSHVRHQHKNMTVIAL